MEPGTLLLVRRGPLPRHVTNYQSQLGVCAYRLQLRNIFLGPWRAALQGDISAVRDSTRPKKETIRGKVSDVSLHLLLDIPEMHSVTNNKIFPRTVRFNTPLVD